MSPRARTLVVMRHAKAEPDAASDAERPLAPRGHDDAAAAGRWLRETGVDPDQALVSYAVRTRETWDHLSSGAGWDDVTVTVDRGLYAAGVDSALDLLRLLPASATSVVVVGHNPTMGTLAQLLDDGEGDAATSDALIARGFPTSAVAVFSVELSWADLAPGTATLAAFHVGRA